MSGDVFDLPASATASWWLSAWLQGAAAADDVLTRLDLGEGTSLCLLDGSETSLLDLLIEIRRQRASHAGLALPRPGDPLGLGGPLVFNSRALEVGEAVVVGRLGLVPVWLETHYQWQMFTAAPRPLPDLPECSRQLRRELLRSAEGLAELDVASWRPEAADVLMNLRNEPPLDAPDWVPEEYASLAARGLLALQVVELALVDEGGALGVVEAERRRSLLMPLEQVARRAMVAACSPETWPDHPHGGRGR